MHGCDGCCMCCKMMKVEELEKRDDRWCQHCQIGSGCRIYDTRPESCRIYECVWLQSQRMDKPLPLELRPDKSRVIIGTMNRGEEVVLYVSQERPDAWRQPAFRPLLEDFRRQRLAVHVSCADRLTRI